MNSEHPSRNPLRDAIVACCVGILLLAFCFGRNWVPTRWTVQTRPQLVQEGRKVASRFGVNAGGWKASASPNIDKPLAYFAQQHSSDAAAHSVSPLSLRITYSGTGAGAQAEVWLDSSGRLLRWRAPAGRLQQPAPGSQSDVAEQAFQLLAGNRAPAYGNVIRTSGDELHQEQYTWKTAAGSGSILREHITIVMEGSSVRSAERTVAFSSEENEKDADAGDNQGYWNALDLIYGLACFTAVIAAIWIFMVWRIRRAFNSKFPFRIAAAALLAMILIVVASLVTDAETVAQSIVAVLFSSAFLFCLVAVARGVSAEARPKWFSLEQLARLAPLSKLSGHAIAAGLLSSPLLLAVPFVVALLPNSHVLASRSVILYSRSPLPDSISVQSFVYLVGFFGFAVPSLRRLIRIRWLRWFFLGSLGLLFFAERSVPIVGGPIFAPLLAGFCCWAIFARVYRSFDLLAVLTLQLSTSLLLSAIVLTQKGFAAWSIWLALICLAALAWWLIRHGQPAADGDPLATVPALISFRAEREKLKAEFQVARRAQQDMLPRTAPQIPGYTIAASCTPSLEVGGDLYDFLKLPDGRIGIGVADVSGKGVPAALYMTLTKGLLASVTKNNSSLESVIEEVNRHLHGVTRKKVFVTMALGFLDADRGVLNCVRAGHNPVVWRQPGRDLTTLVSPGGLGLGITASRIFASQLKVAELILSEGDAVVFYSDGITEAMNSELEQFGEQRLMEAVQKADHLDATAARDSILADVGAFLGSVHPQDDMTLVVLRVGARNELAVT